MLVDQLTCSKCLEPQSGVCGVGMCCCHWRALRGNPMPSAAGNGAPPPRPPAPHGLFDGVFGAASPAVVATGGAARRGGPPGALRDPWDAPSEGDRAAQAAAGGPTSRRCAARRHHAWQAVLRAACTSTCLFRHHAASGMLYQGKPLWLCALAGRHIPFSL